MTEACNLFNKWCELNKLTLNFKKCKKLILSNSTGKKLRELKSSVNIEIGAHSLDLVNEFEYLGITIDENIRFSSHTNCIRNSTQTAHT